MTQFNKAGGTRKSNLSEPPAQVHYSNIDYPKDAEIINGRWAMLGLTALVGAYLTTGQIIPGIY